MRCEIESGGEALISGSIIMNVSFRGSSDTGVRISLVQQAAFPKTCHSEPVRRLVWESPPSSRLHSPKDGDCHWSRRVGSQWPGSRTCNDGKSGVAMTGDSMVRGLRDVYRSRKNLWKQPFIPFFQFCSASKAARTGKFPDCNKNLRKRKK